MEVEVEVEVALLEEMPPKVGPKAGSGSVQPAATS